MVKFAKHIPNIVTYTMKLNQKFQYPSFLVLMCLLFWSHFVAAQSNNTVKLNWQAQRVMEADGITPKNIESFELASFDLKYPSLSLFAKRVKGSYGGVELRNQQFEEVKTSLTSEQIAVIGTEVIIESGIVLDRKQPHFVFTILPYRKNANTGKVERLISFSYELKPSSQQSRSATAARNYADNSVLRQGQWFKVGVASTGMYKITFNDLEKLGINPLGIDPRNLRVYGNGGGVLPENNLIPRYDDLQENAIRVVGENDGKFDREDYILFYGFGPNGYVVDTNSNIITHVTNTYSLESFYFINFEMGPGKRVAAQAENTQAPNQFVSDFNTFVLHETNKSTSVNTTMKSGRERYGEEFGNVDELSFPFQIPNVVTTKPMRIRTDVIGRSQSPLSTTFRISYNNQVISNLVCVGVAFSYDAPYGSPQTSGHVAVTPSADFTVKLNFIKSDFSSLGFLNFILVNAYRELRLDAGQLSFRNIDSYGAGKFTEYSITTADPATSFVWDITNKIEAKQQTFRTIGNQIRYVSAGDQLREYCVFSGSDFPSPRIVGTVANQNLHALGFYDFIIISPAEFSAEANRLADFRRTNNNLRCLVVQPEAIFNEFSSGAQDASGIRDFVKMFYDRAGNNAANFPKYLLLFGDGSYDNIGYVPNNTNFVTTFESRNSTSQFGSYVSDDFYGLLDDVEGDWDYSTFPAFGTTAIDVAVGRLPIQNNLQARQMVDKIIHYSNPATFGDWRNKYVLLADDQDNNLHFVHSENHYRSIIQRSNKFNIDKIYMDSYQQVSTPAGNRFPEVNAAFNQRVNTGALVINYIGHGGENGLAHEKILTIEDINSWKGKDNMPVLLTATCSFSRWDDPAFQSAGELCLLNPNGGAIGMFTTTRVVFAYENEAINRSFILALFDSTNVGSTKTLGDIFRESKNFNGLGLGINQRNFTLLGDPSLPFATPKFNVVTEAINNESLNNFSDTIKALNTITIKGFISDQSGNFLSGYNGTVYPTVFDKKTAQKTLGQDVGPNGSSPANYMVQRNVIYKGKASVVNGRFSFSFVVPKDINYTVGFGRLNYYASLNGADANGAYDSVLIGGSSNEVINDTKGPEMQVYLNSEQFARGGITNESPLLIVKIRDDNGINTVGNGIGHNLSATLNDGTNNRKIDLNEFYEAQLDSYQEGEVRYPFDKLSPGKYTLTIKAWDVVNNSAEISTDFTVIESQKFSIDKVYNYPNPFTTKTDFQFEHNRPGEPLEVMVQIFTISGKLVKTIAAPSLGLGTRIANIGWDGKDSFGDRLARGVYVYKLKVRAADGSTAEKYEKLVIL